jgi:hypothetical protein
MIAGFLTGLVVAPFEYLKVEIQSRTRLGYPPVRLRKLLAEPDIYRKILHSILPFACLFAGVCSIEFSVNERIKHKYGVAAGVTASAITGSSFLTAADHLMYKKSEGENLLQAIRGVFATRWNCLWTGFVPMAMRECIFIISVMQLGPFLGAKIR